MITSQPTQERVALPWQPSLTDFARMEPGANARTNDGLSSFIGVVQNLVEETRALIDVHYALIRIALDEKWARAHLGRFPCRRASAREAGQPANENSMNSLLFRFPGPCALPGTKMLAQPTWTALDRAYAIAPAARGCCSGPPRHARQSGTSGLIGLTR